MRIPSNGPEEGSVGAVILAQGLPAEESAKGLKKYLSAVQYIEEAHKQTKTIPQNETKKGERIFLRIEEGKEKGNPLNSP